jgi:hypothetical protein
MICITALKEKDIGREVVFELSGKEREFGHISSWNGRFIFVRYGSNTQSQATNPENLRWSISEEEQ